MKPFLNILHLNPDLSLSVLELSALYQNIQELKEQILKVIFLGDLTGKRVLLKPNWVLQPRSHDDEICLITHEYFLLAFLEVILEKKPASVIIGDAPIQGCVFEKLFVRDFINKVHDYSKKFNIPVKVKDFRRTIFDQGTNKLMTNNNPLDDYVVFNIGEKSYLEPISENIPNFRVTDYNPNSLFNSHRKGVHKYCITKDLFESDVVISIPKIKTHQKTGITNSLKILVGLNGDKDFLPHHRKGGSKNGGDCYPGSNFIRRLSENVFDMANKDIGSNVYPILKKTAKFIWKMSLPTPFQSYAAAWYGNDTTWRMVLDLNMIALYGSVEGKIQGNTQREMYSLCDGIVGGQGDGPLLPKPLNLGIICFTNNAALADAAVVTLFGYDLNKVPLVSNAIQLMLKEDYTIELNKKKINSISELEKFSIMVEPPRGWIGHIEK